MCAIPISLVNTKVGDVCCEHCDVFTFACIYKLHSVPVYVCDECAYSSGVIAWTDRLCVLYEYMCTHAERIPISLACKC